MKSFFFIFLTTGLIYGVVESQECGTQKFTSELIHGGNESVPGQWPWLAPYFELEGTNEVYVCGSTLISHSHVLTAAHCIHGKFKADSLRANKIRIYLGRTSFKDDDEQYERREASEIILHPNWDHLSDRFDADIAIIKMRTRVDYTDFIQPACLPDDSFNVFATNGSVAGFGLTEFSILRNAEGKMRHIRIPTTTNEKCVFSFPEYAKKASERTFCAGEKGKIPCNGDSGSGFYTHDEDDSQFSVTGIVSASAQLDDRCDPNQFVIFTNVIKFKKWIYVIVPEIKPKSAEINWYSYKDNNMEIKPSSVNIYEGATLAYIGRAWHDDKLIVGKFIPIWNTFYLAYFNQEVKITDGNFELLQINGNYRWIPFNRRFPKNAVEGGREGAQKLFIGKKLHNGNDLIGKIPSIDKVIYVSYFDKELRFDNDFYILIAE